MRPFLIFLSCGLAISFSSCADMAHKRSHGHSLTIIPSSLSFSADNDYYHFDLEIQNRTSEACELIPREWIVYVGNQISRCTVGSNLIDGFRLPSKSKVTVPCWLSKSEVPEIWKEMTIRIEMTDRISAALYDVTIPINNECRQN